MDEPTITRHSFIVRLWQEQSNTNLQEQEYFWRGSVTHVPSGLSHHFHNINEVSDFIRFYLDIEERFTVKRFIESLRLILKG